MVVSFYWRYACDNFPCFRGGNVSSAMAFSYNARNWTAFGQFDSNHVSRASNCQSDTPVARAPQINTDLAGPAYHHTYVVYANKTAGAFACQAECDGDEQCQSWTYVIGGRCCGEERCCRFGGVGCPYAKDGCVSGAKVDKAPCSIPAPPTPSPTPAPQVVPELFPNTFGSPFAGQVCVLLSSVHCCVMLSVVCIALWGGFLVL